MAIMEAMPESVVQSDPWVEPAAAHRGYTSIVETILKLCRAGIIQMNLEQLLLSAVRGGHTGAVKLIMRYLGKSAVQILYFSEHFWTAVKAGFTSQLAGAILGFGNDEAILVAAKRLLPIAVSEGSVRALRMLLRPRKIGTALVDVHQDNDAALLADVDTGMSTGVEFLFGGGANPEYTWWEKAMRLAKRRKFRSVVDIMKRHGDKASWTES